MAGLGPGPGSPGGPSGQGGRGASPFLGLSALLAPTPVVLAAPIPARQAWGACLLMTAIYVFSLYLLPASIRRRPRDDPVHIRARFASVATACLLALRIFLFFLRPPTSPAEAAVARPALDWLGLSVGAWLRRPWLQCVAALPVVLLFLGPLGVTATEIYVDRWYDLYSAQGRFVMKRRSHPHPASWRETAALRLRRHGQTRYTLLRNLLVAPVTEEIAFRACMLPLLRAAFSADSGSHSANARAILLSPVLFGVAHLHHAWQRVAREGAPVKLAVLGFLLQFAYTGVFGWLAGFLLLRTGQALPCVLAHAFCNLMGLPGLGPLLAPPPRGLATPAALTLYRYRALFWLLYALGIALFAWSLFPLTDPGWFAGAGGAPPFYWQAAAAAKGPS